MVTHDGDSYISYSKSHNRHYLPTSSRILATSTYTYLRSIYLSIKEEVSYDKAISITRAPDFISSHLISETPSLIS